MDPASVEQFGKRKRAKASDTPSLPTTCLFYTKASAVDGKAAVRIHGCLDIHHACSLPAAPQHDSVEQQRQLFGIKVSAFEFNNVRLISEPVLLAGNSVLHSGNTGTFVKGPELLAITKELRLNDWPKSVRIHDDQLWAVTNSSIPCLCLATDTASKLGMKLQKAKIYKNCPGCSFQDPNVGDCFGVTTKPIAAGPIRYEFLPVLLVRAWMMARLLRAGMCMKKVFMLAAKMVFSPLAVSELEVKLSDEAYHLPCAQTDTSEASVKGTRVAGVVDWSRV